MVKKPKSVVAYKSTQMIQLRGDILRRDPLSEVEQKAVLYIASQVKPDNKEGDTYIFRYRDFANIAGIEVYGQLYKDMSELLYGLQSKRVLFRDEEAKGTKGATMIVSPTFYDNGAIEYQVDRNLLPHFKAFAAGFTVIDVTDYMKIRGRYPLALYELMLSWAEKKQVDYTIEELRQKLSAPEDAYPRNNDFVRQVRLAIEEINEKSNKIHVETEEHYGPRRKVEAITFKIKTIGGKPKPDKSFEDEMEERGQIPLVADQGAAVQVEAAKNEMAATVTETKQYTCPRCGKGVIVPRAGGTFWGCSRWARNNQGCNYTQNIDPASEAAAVTGSGKPDCPKCKGLGKQPTYPVGFEGNPAYLRLVECSCAKKE